MSKKKKNNNDDFLAKEAKEQAKQALDYTLDIPEDEIWTYRIEGLQAPRVGKKPENLTTKKAIVIIILLIAISLSIFFSVRALYVDEYDFEELDNGTVSLTSFSNPGEVREVTVDYYIDNAGNKDESKPVTEIKEFAFNCDGEVQKIYVGKDVEKLYGSSFYSCWALQYVDIDDDNSYYCDVDGVVYSKDMTEIIYYPIDHDRYLRLKTGYAYLDDDGVQHSNLVDDNGNEMEELWGTTEKYDEAYFDKYNKDVRTYVIPSTVTKIDALSFTYVNINYIYIPEGVKEIGSMAFFDSGNIWQFYSYVTDGVNLDTTNAAVDTFTNIYRSLPDGLESIGSDAFTKDKGIDYMYIPESVTEIGHHAFWDTVYKENGELKAVTVMNIAADEQTFNSNTECGDQWLPKYEKKLFKSNIDVNYSAEREYVK